MNEEITLISVTREYIKGHEKTTENKWTVNADVKDPTRTEFYQAMKAGLKASIVFKVYTDELCKASFVEYEGVRYEIKRTFRVDVNYTEITCSEVV